jgi:hypothetical protein
MKSTNLHIQRGLTKLRRRTVKKTISKHTMSKVPKTNDKEKMLKVIRK